MIGVKISLLVLFVSGLIAYLGDLIGRRVGRKKLSFFGLRPRKFAALVSVVAGVLISLFTLAVLTAVSPQARQALFGLEKLEREKAHLSSELRKRASQLKKTKEELNTKRKALYTAQGKLSAIQKRLAFVERSAKEKKELLRKARGELKRLEKEKGRIEATLKSLQGELKESEERLEEARKSVEMLSKDKALLQKEIQSLLDSDARLTKRIASLKEKIEQGSRELSETKKEIERLKKKYSRFLSRKLLLGAKEPLGYFIIEKGTSKKEAREKLEKSLQSLEAQLSLLGAGKEEGETILFYEHQIQEILARANKSKHPLLVRILSKNNVVAGEPVLLEFQVVPNRMIIPEGTSLGVALLPKNLPREEIEQRLIFLMQKAHRKALSLGLLPEADFQTLTPREFTFLVDKIVEANQELYAEALAQADVFVSGPLILWISVREKPYLKEK